MRPKLQFYLLSIITLLLFPAIGLLLLWFFSNINLLSVFELDKIVSPMTLLGLEFGFLYGFVVIAITQLPMFEEMSKPQTRMLKNLNLKWPDVIFMSFCAGFGEEILFRAGLQTFLGPWLTSFLFIAIHGYFSPFSLKKNAIGILLFPFILLISYAYDVFGLWFCVAAHFSYDLLMFIGVMQKE
ncbi:hypothetical protein CW751_04430 [Brumimicrobium salinarum]|uniref:CAAX prenyl protease 2/Lysostaphin resistance protein A-like domain-containing protein n=1 Tax=Brumimicrobium salinarum TaxID=2058658 RepID=A0A2I0R407_9FLAO|nr:CPBP family intramembrane glutamic endopeptidase [Brumimicrobium salinarum]PKR81311.1 hypothetical protein CW751_04430 [Brumimicrobium salinarum]